MRDLIEQLEMTPQRFYLIAERRDDGGLRITCPEVPGLVLSHADPHAVMRDVIPAIDTIMRHNRRQVSDASFEAKIENHRYAKAAARAYRKHALALVQQLNDAHARLALLEADLQKPEQK